MRISLPYAPPASLVQWIAALGCAALALGRGGGQNDGVLNERGTKARCSTASVGRRASFREVRTLTRVELLAVARRAYELHPDLGSAGAADPLLTMLLGQIDDAYDSSRPVESAKEALQHVALGVFVVLSALYSL